MSVQYKNNLWCHQGRNLKVPLQIGVTFDLHPWCECVTPQERDMSIYSRAEQEDQVSLQGFQLLPVQLNGFLMVDFLIDTYLSYSLIQPVRQFINKSKLSMTTINVSVIKEKKMKHS